MRQAVRVSTSGEMEVVDLDAPQGALKVMQEAVEGYIEPVDITSDLCMYVDEEFLYNKADQPNRVATAFYHRIGGRYTINGPVIFTGGVDDEGETAGLTAEQIDLLKQVVGRVA